MLEITLCDITKGAAHHFDKPSMLRPLSPPHGPPLRSFHSLSFIISHQSGSLVDLACALDTAVLCVQRQRLTPPTMFSPWLGVIMSRLATRPGSSSEAAASESRVEIPQFKRRGKFGAKSVQLGRLDRRRRQTWAWPNGSSCLQKKSSARRRAA